MSQTLLEMTKALVLAQIEARHVTPENLETVLHRMYETLQQLQAAEDKDMASKASASKTTTLDWKDSIHKYTIKCLECGDLFRQLSRRHLQKHGLDARSYRLKYGIPRQQSLSSRVASARRRQLAKSIRPWERSHAGKSTLKRANLRARGVQGKKMSG